MHRTVAHRTIAAAGGLAIAAIMGLRLTAQHAAQLCPPCAAIGEAQKVPEDLAREALIDRGWAVGDHGINAGEWQKTQGDKYRLGTGATILQIDTGVTQHPLLPRFNQRGSGVDFKGADNFFGVGYSNEDPLLSGLLRFPGHGTKTSSVITATRPPLAPPVPPAVSLVPGGSLAAKGEITISYAYRDDVLGGESRESALVKVTPDGTTLAIRVEVTGSADPLVGTIDVYAQDNLDAVRRRVKSIPNPVAGTATTAITAKTWGARDPEAPTPTPWRLHTAEPGDRMRGAAPGVHLIPLRGTQGVLLIPGKLGELDTEPWRIANALNQAALGKEGLFRTQIDVVSMSLGTWPETDGLCAAVKRATDAGVIVIAAAGNQVKRTKYPAKCPTAIAVAGSNYQQRPWSGSAGSPEVAIAAPAEGVWTASVVGGTFCTEASYGTSFATALVASMAAEWVAFHRANGRTLPIEKVGTPANPGPFRAALMASARAWKGSDRETSAWRKTFGPGIADLSRLMAAAEQGHAIH